MQGSALGQPLLKVPLPEWLGAVDDAGQPLPSADLAATDFVVAALALGLATLDLASHHSNFTLNNLIACCLAADILQLVGLRSFRVAGVLLAGLLAYDVFWVGLSG